MAKSFESPNKKKSGCVKAKCTCHHKFQDSLYGQSVRVWNCTSTGGRTCTVCGSTHK